MAPRTILQAMIQNESGGRNIPNVHQGTSSGQAQGYYQITTGTWRDFAPRVGVDLSQYPTALSAPHDIQARVAGAIPMNRWDPSTIAKMRSTGKPLDLSRTFGENLAMNGESFADFTPKDGGGQYRLSNASPLRHVGGAGSNPDYFKSNPAAPGTRHVGGAGSAPGNFQDPSDPRGAGGTQPYADPVSGPADVTQPLKNPYGGMLSELGKGFKGIGGGELGGAAPRGPGEAARADAPAVPPLVPVDTNRRMMLAQLMAQLNSGRLWG